MNGNDRWASRVRLPRFSLRTLLGAAALAALVTAVALAALVQMTGGATRDVVATVQQTHDRVQTYSQLISAVRVFQNASYADAQLRTPQSAVERRVAHDRYRAALAAALLLPRDTAHRRELAAQIERQGEGVERHLARTLDIVARVDEVWRTEGSKAAGLEAEVAARPFRNFVSLLDAEIAPGDTQIAVAADRALKLSRRVVIASLVCLCLALASWALVHVLLLRRIAPGLRRLEEGTRAFAAGDLARRVQLGGHDELARLSSAFDTMAEMLAAERQALRRVQVGLERAVRERTEELERANGELSASDGRRRAFLADIGHELRTPLTIIRGEAQVALRTMRQPAFDPREAFERIIEHTHDLGGIVDDLFLIARAEAGGLPMHLRPTDLRELTLRAACDFEALATDLGATIRAVPGAPVVWPVDSDRLRRALSVLIDNALRHTREGVRVVIEARRTAHGVLISVTDDGPGVDPALVPELFQRFRRGHTRGEGSGLGLSLARALVEAQAGRTRLENRLEGGARAVMEFRRAERQEEEPKESNHESAVG